jgi:hypothetical protein
MREYFRQHDYLAERVTVHYLGGCYTGRGILKWTPEKGFHLEAFMERKGPPLADRLEFYRSEPAKESDYHSIRMVPQGMRWAVTPKFPLVDRLDLVEDRHLSINLASVTFCTEYDPPVGCESCGSATYRLGNSLLFGDTAITEMRIGDKKITKLHESALLHSDDIMEIQGIHLPNSQEDDPRDLEVTWTFIKRVPYGSLYWQYWHWPEALGQALSILSGRTVHLLYREMCRCGRKYTQYRRSRDVEHLGDLAPLGSSIRVNKDALMKLAGFLAHGSRFAEYCLRMFYQLVEASRQETWQATELLCSTILEAALRSIDNHAFKKGDYSWKIKASLEQFRSHFLSEAWREACHRVLDVRERLRHRNAHPDWLTRPGGALSPKEQADSLDDMIYLTRFYGYMILAMAGFKNLEPKFPTPIAQWTPGMIRGKDKDTA